MEDLIYQGVKALKDGDKSAARTFLLSAVEKNADSMQAWLWLSGAVDSEEDQLECLQQVLKIDPGNEPAAKGVAYLTTKGVVLPQPADQEESSVSQGVEDAASVAEVVAPEATPQADSGAEPVMESSEVENPPTPETLSIAPMEEPEPKAEDQEAFNSIQGADEAVTAVEEFPQGMDMAVQDAGASLEGAGTTLEGPDISFGDLSSLWEDSEDTGTAFSQAEIGTQGGEGEGQTSEVEAAGSVSQVQDAALESPGATEDDAFKLPASFFEPLDGQAEELPDWLVNPTEDEASIQSQVSPFQTQESHEEPVEAEQPAFTSTSQPVSLSSTESTKPEEMVTNQAGTTATVKAEEHTLFKIRPSLVTPILGYGTSSVVLFAIALVILFTASTMNTIPLLVVAGVIIFLLLIMLILLISVTLNHLLASYTVTNRRMYLMGGVLRVSRKSVPLETIQTITMKQGFLQKIFGIGHLEIEVAKPEGGEETFHLVDVAKAKRTITRIEGALSENNQ